MTQVRATRTYILGEEVRKGWTIEGQGPKVVVHRNKRGIYVCSACGPEDSEGYGCIHTHIAAALDREGIA